MEKCENTRDVTVLGKNREEKTAILFNPRCKMWSCDYCAELNKDYWIHQATRGTLLITSEGREIQFVTLTSRSYATPTKSLYFFKQNWPKLNRRLKYHTQKSAKESNHEWSYFMVPERHQSGVLHTHILAVTPIKSEAEWKKHAYQSGFGYILDVSPLVSATAASNYVAKYLHKGSGAETWPKGFMRIRHSRNWPIAGEKPLEGWEWETYKNPDTIFYEKGALIDLGWNVVDKRENQ